MMATRGTIHDNSFEEEDGWGQAWDQDLPVELQLAGGSVVQQSMDPTLYRGTYVGTDNSSTTEAGLPLPKITPDVTENLRQENADQIEKAGGSGAEDSKMLSRMRLNDNKAGMEGLDREKINQIIYEASKGSSYYENELKKEEQMNKRINEQKRKISQFNEDIVKHGAEIADTILANLEGNRDLSRTIVHVDMDAFYAAVEMKHNPSLRDKPMAVGGMSMLSTSNYIARRYGVRAAMPGFIAKKLCPELVIVPTSFDKYKDASQEVRAVLVEYDANMCPMSLDEAYLDITDHLQKRETMSEADRTYKKTEICSCEREPAIAELSSENSQCNQCQKPRVAETVTFGLSIEDAVEEMRFRICEKTGLTASAGIAPNTMLAKVCSDKNKPNGQYRIQPTSEAVMHFITDLPIRKVSGIGKVSEKMLSALDAVLCRDLYKHRGLLYYLYSETSFNYFMRICLGIGTTRVGRDGERKSMSVERTFPEINKPAELYKKCYELCQHLSEDLRSEGLVGKTVTLKLKLCSFELRTRAHSLLLHTDEFESIYGAARDVLRQQIQQSAPAPLRLRLMGVCLSILIGQTASEKTKQKTITGLFKKLEVKQNSPNTSPVKQNTSKGSPVNLASTDFPTNLIEDVLDTMLDKEEASFEVKSPAKKDRKDFMNVIFKSKSPQKDIFCPSPKKSQVDHTSLQISKNQESHQRCEDTKPSGKHVSLFGFVKFLKVHSQFERDAVVFKDACNHQKVTEKVACLTVNKSSSTASSEISPTQNDQQDGSSYFTSLSATNELASHCNNKVMDQPTGAEQSLCGVSEADTTVSEEFLAEQPSPSVKPTQLSPSSSSTKDSIHDNTSKSVYYQCPVCFMSLSFQNMKEFSDHVDDCLSLKAIKSDHIVIDPPPELAADSVVPQTQHAPDQSDSDDIIPKLQQIDKDLTVKTVLTSDATSEGPECTQKIYLCPVCNAPQRKADLALFNQHVDACLNRQVIKDIIREPWASGQTKTNKRPTAAPSNSTGRSAKKLKVDSSKQKGNPKLGTLHSFLIKK